MIIYVEKCRFLIFETDSQLGIGKSTDIKSDWLAQMKKDTKTKKLQEHNNTMLNWLY